MINFKINMERSHPSNHILRVSFSKDVGTGFKPVGRLLRPSSPKYEVNQQASAITFLSFIEDVKLKRDALFPITECDESLYIRYYDSTDELDLRIDTKCITTSHLRTMRIAWNGLIRSGFRPSLGMFS